MEIMQWNYHYSATLMHGKTISATLDDTIAKSAQLMDTLHA